MQDNILLSFLSRHKRTLNILLAIAGFIDLGFYYFCGDSCLYLAGTLLGVDLKIWGLLFLSVFLVISLLKQNLLKCLLLSAGLYLADLYLAGTLLGNVEWGLLFLSVFLWGLLFLSVFLVISLLKQDLLICLLLSAGMGGEIFLVGYQIVNKTYCPFCLIFALIIAILLVINAPSFIKAEKKKRSLLLIGATFAGLIGMSFFFQATPTGAAHLTLPKFGEGPVNVRLYSDYFCGPCQKLEPDVEKILLELIEENKIRLVFVDVPTSSHTPLYISYYLALAQQEKSLEEVFHIRQLLFDAAKDKITDNQALAKYLTDNGLPEMTVSREQPPAESFRYMKEDGIDTTPMMVIVRENEKETYAGRTKILNALEELK